jgi:DNA repair ATPase RecN
MKKVRDLNSCIAQLRALRGRNDTEPEQTKYIDEAIELLKQLRRKSHPSRADVAQFVRKIAEALLSAFKK